MARIRDEAIGQLFLPIILFRSAQNFHPLFSLSYLLCFQLFNFLLIISEKTPKIVLLISKIVSQQRKIH